MSPRHPITFSHLVYAGALCALVSGALCGAAAQENTPLPVYSVDSGGNQHFQASGLPDPFQPRFARTFSQSGADIAFSDKTRTNALFLRLAGPVPRKRANS
jgi:hypothetical protein